MGKSKGETYTNYEYVSPEVIMAAVNGNVLAQQVIIERYSAYAIKVAKSRTRKERRKGMETSIDDILQIAWIGVLEDIRKFKGK